METDNKIDLFDVLAKSAVELVNKGNTIFEVNQNGEAKVSIDFTKLVSGDESYIYDLIADQAIKLSDDTLVALYADAVIQSAKYLVKVTLAFTSPKGEKFQSNFSQFEIAKSHIILFFVNDICNYVNSSTNEDKK